MRDKVDFLYRGKYTGFNVSHFATGEVPYAQFAYKDSVEENRDTFKKIVEIISALVGVGV